MPQFRQYLLSSEAGKLLPDSKPKSLGPGWANHPTYSGSGLSDSNGGRKTKRKKGDGESDDDGDSSFKPKRPLTHCAPRYGRAYAPRSPTERSGPTPEGMGHITLPARGDLARPPEYRPVQRGSYGCLTPLPRPPAPQSARLR